MPQNDKQPQREPNTRSTIIWLAIILFVAFMVGQQFFMNGSSQDGRQEDQLITSEFLQAVEQDRVVSVVYDARNYTVTGTYYPAVTAGQVGVDAFNDAFGSLNTRLSLLEQRPDGSLTGIGTKSIDASTLGTLHNYRSTYVGQ